jgi:hypothetical protein
MEEFQGNFQATRVMKFGVAPIKIDVKGTSLLHMRNYADQV